MSSNSFFVKMTGAGNDFIIFDGRESLDKRWFDPSIVRKICDRHFGVGADGLLVIEKQTVSGADFKWTFFNSDGGNAEMCGNAARCAIRFVAEKAATKKETWVLQSEAGLVEGKMLAQGIVEVKTTPPKILDSDKKVSLGPAKFSVSLIDTGVPHAVVKIADWDPAYLDQLGHELRPQTMANITFCERLGENHIQSATFERGVESVTLACGTGAIAAALVSKDDPYSPGTVDVSVPGGTLYVRTTGKPGEVFLSGSARYVCQGHLNEEVML